MKNRSVAMLLALTVVAFSAEAPPAPPQPEKEWRWDETISEPDTVFTAEMTAGEIASAQRNGKRLAIVPIGGLEQNGPYVVTGKHDFAVTILAEEIALQRGDALIVPTVSFVPQGSIDPPTGHMKMPGTISLSETTYEALLTDISRSLLATGFEAVILIGDSGGNQQGMEAVAARLDGVYAITEFYQEDFLDAARLSMMGVIQGAEADVHTDYRYEAILSTIDPDLFRWTARGMTGALETRGVDISNLNKLQADGRDLIEYRAALTNRAINQRLGLQPVGPQVSE